jgi:hypothetical protein
MTAAGIHLERQGEHPRRLWEGPTSYAAEASDATRPDPCNNVVRRALPASTPEAVSSAVAAMVGGCGTSPIRPWDGRIRRRPRR